MKLAMVQILFMMLLLLLCLGRGLGMRFPMASTVLEDNDQALSEFWFSDSQDKVEISEGEMSFQKAESLAQNIRGVMLPEWSEQTFLSEDKVGIDGLLRAETRSQHSDEQHGDDLMARDCNNLMAPKIKMTNSLCINNYTFIHEDVEKFKAVCTSPTVPCTHKGGKCHKSSSPFEMTLCKLSKADQISPNCHYLTFIMKKYIIMTCTDTNIHITSEK
ncbi:inactive ribonuclease-like protein 10 [Sorex fumeus]|uniref:inactive ribonuclease-like protein 10 n=1 Tax=Sorex fumeus TaxID=62283 RepID=UPI0024AE0B40|nr:inactive ribonuclease-like protein 10 [Sorex fumeus]